MYTSLKKVKKKFCLSIAKQDQFRGTNVNYIIIKCEQSDRKLIKARFTLQKCFGTAPVKLGRVPKKSTANFVYTTPFLPYQKYRTKIFGPT